MSRLRILVLASFCDPEAVSMPYVAYCHAAALARFHDVTLAIEGPKEASVRRAKGSFHGIEVIRMPLLERLYAWSLRWIFRYNFASQALTAFMFPFSIAFEFGAWRHLRRRIHANEFDIVLRLLPTTAVLPSPFAFFLRKGPIPIVIGPINGGLPFVEGFKQAQNQKQWISRFRTLYRFMPFARSTYYKAAAILVASSHTYQEFSQYHDKLFFVPENGVSGDLCVEDSRSGGEADRLELIFVGGLIPCKACDLALRGAAPLLRSGLAHFTILGDGPERSSLEQLAKDLGIEGSVVFRGWVSHEEVLQRLRAAEILVFPSVRDFGAGVVFEALACGAIPVVSDFGGPGDIVRSDIGCKVTLTNESDVVAQLEKILFDLANNDELRSRLREQGMLYAREHLTWDAKAQDTTRILHWVLGLGPRPDLLPPAKTVTASHESSEPASAVYAERAVPN